MIWKDIRGVRESRVCVCVRYSVFLEETTKLYGISTYGGENEARKMVTPAGCQRRERDSV